MAVVKSANERLKALKALAGVTRRKLFWRPTRLLFDQKLIENGAPVWLPGILSNTRKSKNFVGVAHAGTVAVDVNASVGADVVKNDGRPSILNKLQVVQNNTLRLISGSHRKASRQHLHSKTKILPVAEHLENGNAFSAVPS